MQRGASTRPSVQAPPPAPVTYREPGVNIDSLLTCWQDCCWHREREREGSVCIDIYIESYVGVTLKRRAGDTRSLYVFADADGQKSSCHFWASENNHGDRHCSTVALPKTGCASGDKACATEKLIQHEINLSGKPNRIRLTVQHRGATVAQRTFFPHYRIDHHDTPYGSACQEFRRIRSWAAQSGHSSMRFGILLA